MRAGCVRQKQLHLYSTDGERKYRPLRCSSSLACGSLREERRISRVRLEEVEGGVVGWGGVRVWAWVELFDEAQGLGVAFWCWLCQEEVGWCECVFCNREFESFRVNLSFVVGDRESAFDTFFGFGAG
jgi:hypothetical protein